MPPNRKLPSGFERLPSGSLRVRLRFVDRDDVSKVFPLHSSSNADKQRQLLEAESWAAETRRRLMAGTHVSTRAAEQTRLGDALRRFQTEGLRSVGQTRQNEIYRIKTILADPIANRPLAALSKPDIAEFRDRLIQSGWEKSVAASIRRLGEQGEPDRLKDLQQLPNLRKSLNKLKQEFEADSEIQIERDQLIVRINEIQMREDVCEPKRTTIANVVQLISRALKHVSHSITGISDIDVSQVTMPAASPGRERRLSGDEENRLLAEGEKIDARFPLIVKFALATALRRERVLTFCRAFIVDIGEGKTAIVFPKNTDVRNKRTGVVPITTEIRAVIDAAMAVATNAVGREGQSEPLFGLTVDQFKSRWRRLQKAAELEDFHFHDLRHEATSRLLEQGLSAAEVMSITGHSTNDMLDRYSHFSASKVLKKLERGLDVAGILAEIEFLASQYKALKGDPNLLSAVLTS